MFDNCNERVRENRNMEKDICNNSDWKQRFKASDSL